MTPTTRSVPYIAPTPITMNGIDTVYDSFGRAADPPLLLIAGLGVQMIGWEENFCAQLAGRGFRVIRFDNRDIGLATSFKDTGVPDLGRLIEARLAGEIPEVPLPYTAYDMVDDTVALLDELDIEKAHIVGASMGGVIAQLLTIEYQERVRTLTAIMTTTGSADLPLPDPVALSLFMRPPSENKAEYIENAVQGWQIMYGSGYPLDEGEARLRAARYYERSYEPTGTTRQLAATVALESLKPRLDGVTVPTLVIHGDEDPLFPLECGKDIAVSVPDAKMLVLEGVGHALPSEVWPQVIEAISERAAYMEGLNG
ncbi:MAG: alpha/beta hydrolase [Candidatus Promineifilaceae bacterium]